MTIDFGAIIRDAAVGISSSLEVDARARVPWSERWTVASVARHVAGTHHVVAQIVDERPTADFGRFASLDAPAPTGDEFPSWFAAGTTSLCEALASAPADASCWSWYHAGGNVAFWSRRMAYETLVHAWDAGAALGTTQHAISPEIADDAVDEYLSVFVDASRALANAPSGPAIRLNCSDSHRSRALDLSSPGARTVTEADGQSALELTGTAWNVLLFLWGRLTPAAAELTVRGDTTVLDRWRELIPPM